MRANVTSKQFLVHMAPCDVVLLRDVLQHWEDHLVVKVLDILHVQYPPAGPGNRARVPTQATDFWVLEPTRCQRSILHTHTHQTGELILMAKRRAATLPMRRQTSPN